MPPTCKQHGLAGVVSLAAASDKSFGADPRGGPWVSVLRRDRGFAEAYARMDRRRVRLLLTVMARTLFDRDTAPGAEPEDLLRLDVPASDRPGRAITRTRSRRRAIFEECLDRARNTGMFPTEQTKTAADIVSGPRASVCLVRLAHQIERSFRKQIFDRRRSRHDALLDGCTE